MSLNFLLKILIKNLVVIIFWSKSVESVITSDDDSNFRIVGGTDANKTAWPFISALACGRLVHCGGTLIRPRWILTAAHCVTGCYDKQKYLGSLSVRVGPEDLDYVDPNSLVKPKYKDQLQFTVSVATGILDTGTIMKGETSYLHPGYKTEDINDNIQVVKHDIALVKLLIKNGLEVQIAPLPTQSVHSANFCIAAGWGGKLIDQEDGMLGTKSVLQELSLNIMKEKKCKKVIKGALKNIYVSESVVKSQTKYKMCGVRGKGLKGIYHGDSGGPIICDGELQGVASQTMYSDTQMVSVFTEIAYYIDWINEILKSNGEDEIASNIHKLPKDDDSGGRIKILNILILVCLVINKLIL